MASVAEKETLSGNLYEKTADVEQFGEIAHERHEAIKNALDREERKHKERHSEREIVAEAEKLARRNESHKDTQKTSPAERRSGPINKKQLGSSFKAQMKFVEAEMNPTERVFSKFIHSKPIEKTSEVLGSTIARPNALLSGSITAFIGVTILYFVSKYYGFQLSGFETIGTFVLGWIIGVLYDYVSLLVKGHNK